MRILLSAANFCVEPLPVYPLGMSVIANVLAKDGDEIAKVIPTEDLNSDTTDWKQKYGIDESTLDQYQKQGMVNKFKAFTEPRYIPTYFCVRGD